MTLPPRESGRLAMTVATGHGWRGTATTAVCFTGVALKALSIDRSREGQVRGLNVPYKRRKNRGKIFFKIDSRQEGRRRGSAVDEGATHKQVAVLVGSGLGADDRHGSLVNLASGLIEDQFRPLYGGGVPSAACNRAEVISERWCCGRDVCVSVHSSVPPLATRST